MILAMETLIRQVKMGVLGVLLFLCAGSAVAVAQPARTSINVTMYRTNGTKFTGTLYISWPTFTSADSYAIPAGNLSLPVTNGVLSTTLVPTDALTGDSINVRYTTRYALSNGQPLSPPLTETWNVPTSGPVTSLNQLRAITPPPFTPTAAPSTGTYITKGVVGGLSSAFSLGTLIDNNILAVDVAASVGTPRAATSTDLIAISGWPSGLDMTELGYVNGVTSALQTQLGGKLALAGGTMTGALVSVPVSGAYAVDLQKSGSAGTVRFYDQTAVTGVTQQTIRAGAGQSTTGLLGFQNNAGATMSQIGPQGDWATYNPSNGKLKSDWDYTQLALASDVVIHWNATDNLNSFSIDTGLARNAAGVVEVNNGTPGALRDIKARNSIVTGSSSDTVAQSFVGDVNGVYVGTGYGPIGGWIQSYGLANLTLNPQGNAVVLGAAGNLVYVPGTFRIATSTPASASATGTVGTIAWDSSYIYIATGTNTWKRVAIATW